MRGDGYEPKDYTACIQIVDEWGTPLKGQALSYRVDGGERQNGTTDEQGFLRLNLSDGAHGVRLADKQQEIYVDNYAGIGLVEDEFRKYPVLTFLTDGSCAPVEDPEQPESKPETEQTTSSPEREEEENFDTPKTGDSSASVCILMAICSLGAVFLTQKADKKENF